MKRLFFTSLALFLLVIIFLLAYNFAFKNNINDATISEDSTQSEDSDSKGFGKENSIEVASSVENPINEDVLGAVVGPNENIYYYSFDDAVFKKATLEGKDKTTLLSNLPGKPIRIVWSTRRDNALILIEGNPKPHWYSASFATKTLTPLKEEVVRVTWNNLGDKIYYLFLNNTTKDFSLNKSNPDGSGWKELTTIGKRDMYLSAIPQSNSVSFWTKPNALEESFFEGIDSEGGTRSKIFTGRYGNDYLWSPNGERFIISSSTEKGGALSLGIANKSGGEFRSLNIPTFISKIVWSKDNNRLFYALPGGLTDATLPNDYFEKNLASQDTFWQIDISTGKSTRLLELSDIGKSFDSIDLQLSPNEDILFFTDRQTKRIHRIDL